MKTYKLTSDENDLMMRRADLQQIFWQGKHNGKNLEGRNTENPADN